MDSHVVRLEFEIDPSDSNAMESIVASGLNVISDSKRITNGGLSASELQRRVVVEIGVSDSDALHSILSSGAKVNPNHKSTQEAFRHLIIIGAYGMCKILFKFGAVNVDATGMAKYMDIVPVEEDLESFQVLIEAVSHVNKKYMGYTALILAAMNGHTEVVRILIEAGSDVIQEANDGCTALVHAAQKGHEEVVRILIKAGSNLNQKNDGWIALIWAARYGHEKIVRILIEAGSDVNQKSNFGNTALIWAAEEGHEEIVRILIEAGSDVNQKNNNGRNAIMTSALYRHAQTSRILLENGADFTAKSFIDERTALDWAKKAWKKNEGTIELLKYAARLHRTTLFIQAIEYLRNHRQEYEEEEVREYIPDHVMNGFFRNTIWKREKKKEIVVSDQ